jgi:hypothetical protein
MYSRYHVPMSAGVVSRPDFTVKGNTYVQEIFHINHHGNLPNHGPQELVATRRVSMIGVPTLLAAETPMVNLRVFCDGTTTLHTRWREATKHIGLLVNHLSVGIATEQAAII